VGVLIVIMCIVRFFLSSTQFDEALSSKKGNRNSSKEAHELLEVVCMIGNVAGWAAFGGLLYVGWGKLRKQRIFFFKHSQYTMVFLLCLDIVLFIVLSVPWLFDEDTYGKCCKGPPQVWYEPPQGKGGGGKGGDSLMVADSGKNKGKGKQGGMQDLVAGNNITADLVAGNLSNQSSSNQSLWNQTGWIKKEKTQPCMYREYDKSIKETYGWINSVSTMLVAGVWAIILQYVSEAELDIDIQYSQTVVSPNPSTP